jgi:hypothetical protein
MSTLMSPVCRKKMNDAIDMLPLKYTDDGRIYSKTGPHGTSDNHVKHIWPI